jgi:AhpD family alkylhydroperoxidase
MAVPSGAWARLQLAGLRIFAGPAVIEAAKAWLYRPAWGKPFSRLLTQGMRSRSKAWSLGERELFAAFTSKLNSCSYCVATHGTVATGELGQDVMDAVLTNWQTAPVTDRVRAMLGFIEKMTLDPQSLGPDDGSALEAAGIDRSAAPRRSKSAGRSTSVTVRPTRTPWPSDHRRTFCARYPVLAPCGYRSTEPQMAAVRVGRVLRSPSVVAAFVERDSIERSERKPEAEGLFEHDRYDRGPRL